ncbi:MAG: Uma2 family endonuclease [Isosphaeraceae bacterium]
MASASQPLLTAQEFERRTDPGYPEELVRGRIVTMPPPGRRHGQVCAQVVYLLRRFLEEHELGHVLSNDSGVITERGPDTVRGPDIAFYSYDRIPKGPLPPSYGPEIPELVFEVRSPGDRWREITIKAGEYLSAGVSFVVILDPDAQTAVVYGGDQPPRMLGPDDELAFPELLGAFRVKVGRLFE